MNGLDPDLPQDWATLVLYSMSDGVLGLDREQRITRANRAALNMVGWSSNELIGQKIHDLLQPRRLDGSPYTESEGPLAWLQSGAALYFIEDVFWHKNGRPLHLEISALNLPQADLDTHYIVLLRDISERKASQAALLKAFRDRDALSQGLEAAHSRLLQSEKLASVGQLAAGVAHEINNPMGFINSNLGTLRTQIGALLSVIAAYEQGEAALSEHSHVLDAIDHAKSAADLEFLREDIQNLIAESLDGAQRVKKIVEDLKDFSRVDTGEWKYANLENGLEKTLNIVWNEIKYKAEVIKEYVALPEIECIASQINQVFMNLLVNAAHAIRERGTITLRTGFDASSVWIEVEDTGTGIKPEHMGKLFTPFFTTKEVGEGTGLGLSLSYGIVQRHHGRLIACSEPGKGTVFRMTLPREKGKGVAPA